MNLHTVAWHWSEAFFALCMSCLEGVVFAGITWLLFEPMRRKRWSLLWESAKLGSESGYDRVN